MSDNSCCQNQSKINVNCPINQKKGKPVKIITPENVLQPQALVKLNKTANYFFCPDENCPVVYFNQQGQTFKIEELKIPVFQKDKSKNVPVCYCFDWTRNLIEREIEETGQSSVEKSIKEKMKAKLCACEINNPQGSCCLANVRQTVNDYQALFGK